MRFAKFGLVFAAIFLCLMVGDRERAMGTRAMASLQLDYNRALDAAAEDAISGLVEKDDGRRAWLNKEEALRRFFVSLAINMNKMESYADRELLCRYVPVVAIVENEGLTIGWDLGDPKWAWHPFEEKYGDTTVHYTLGSVVTVLDGKTGERREGDYRDLRGGATPAFFADEDAFERERRRVIVGLITDRFNEKLAERNEVARKYGITYELALPSIEVEEWYRTVDDVSFLAFFQGYPYGSGELGRYNRMAVGGARLHRR